MDVQEAWIIDAVRTPRGLGRIGKGALADIHPQRLLSAPLAALAERTGIDTADIDDVIIGCGSQWGKQSWCIGRMAALDAGYAPAAPAMTLDRFCGSGLTAIQLAAMGIMAGAQNLVVAGGVESMSHSTTLNGMRLLDSDNLHLRQLHPQPHQGICADLLATLHQFSREDLDLYALHSQTRAARAVVEQRFSGSLVPVAHDDGRIALAHDEYPRPGTTLEGLAALKPAFEALYETPLDAEGTTYKALVQKAFPDTAIHHVHHAGNASGVVDGAGAILLASPDYARTHGLKPRARIRGLATAGASPELMLDAPAPATRKALAQARLDIGDMGLIEINEAFAVVPLKFIRDFDLNPERVNVNGGAIALGHPIGATGAILLGTLLDEMERRDESLGLATMCAAGGMAPAVIIERI